MRNLHASPAYDLDAFRQGSAREDSHLQDAEVLLASWRLLIGLGGPVADVERSLQEGIEVPTVRRDGHALITFGPLPLVCCNRGPRSVSGLFIES